MLKGKTIVLGVTGSIAAYKMANVASMLVKSGCEVHVVMTKNATNFINPIAFESLTNTKCLVETFDRNFQFHVAHVSLTDKADAMLIAPASANIIGKIANGIADDMLSTTVMACNKPVIISPAMNTKMYNNPILQDNLDKLRRFGYEIVEPANGHLACGTSGAGKMPSEEVLVAHLERVIAKEKDLKGKKVLGGRKGGMPEMVFEYTLKKNGIDPSKDLSINQNIDFGSTAAAFAEKKTPADFTVEFEPGATNLEKEGKGYVVASLGTDSGYVPYTAFCAKQSYIKKNASVIQNFTNALQKGMDYVQSHSPEEIASVIAPQFKETDHGTITTILTRYYNQDTWKDNLIFEKKSFDLLQDILESSGELTKRAPYDDLVTTTYAEKAAER